VFVLSGHAFGAATTEGLLIYSLDASLWFDPFQLDMAVTPASIREALKRGENTLALASAIRLNEANVTLEAIETIPLTEGEHKLTLPAAKGGHTMPPLSALKRQESTRRWSFKFLTVT
jgi:hypothetical protein